jgi:hypothetical protein
MGVCTYSFSIDLDGPPLRSSGQISWLQIRRPGFDSRHYQKKCSGSGAGSTQPREYNEELLDRKVATPV